MSVPTPPPPYNGPRLHDPTQRVPISGGVIGAKHVPVPVPRDGRTRLLMHMQRASGSYRTNPPEPRMSSPSLYTWSPAAGSPYKNP